MKLAELVRAWRCHHEMSYRETAEKIGIPESVLRRFERGETGKRPDAAGDHAMGDQSG